MTGTATGKAIGGGEVPTLQDISQLVDAELLGGTKAAIDETLTKIRVAG
jgi:hypothetical protein